jgi:hypothetical protein
MQRLDFSSFFVGAIGVLIGLITYWFIHPDPEVGIPYDVATRAQAKPGWKGEVLEKQALKVAFLSKTMQSCNLEIC